MTGAFTLASSESIGPEFISSTLLRQFPFLPIRLRNATKNAQPGRIDCSPVGEHLLLFGLFKPALQAAAKLDFTARPVATTLIDMAKTMIHNGYASAVEPRL